VEDILHHAEHLEKEYDWLGATESYEKALKLLAEDDFSRKAETLERLGYALYRAAFQAESNDEFRQRLRKALEDYEKAKEFYQRLNDPAKIGRALRCDAMIAYAGYWLAPEVSEKKRLLDECWNLTKEVLKRLEESNTPLECGETFNKLSSSADERYCLESGFERREELIREAIEMGERAIILLSKVNSPLELAKAYVKTGMYLSVFAWYFASDMDEKDRYYRKGLGYWQKATELSAETAFLELLSMPSEGLNWNMDEMLVQFSKALDYAKKTKDKYLIGTALQWLAYITGWARTNVEDPDKIREVREEILRYTTDAAKQFSLVSYVSPFPVNWSGAPYASYYWGLAFGETDLRKKRDLLEKARVEYVAAVKQAKSVGYPDVITGTHVGLVTCLVSLASIETSLEDKRKLLASADEHAKEGMKLREHLERFNYWNLGVSWLNLASVKAELSKIETDDKKKENMLEEAASYGERGLLLCIKYNSYLQKKGDLSNTRILGYFHYVHGEWVSLLYGLTHNDEIQRKALKAFQDSAELFQKLDLASFSAQSHWKAARCYDALGEHLKAAENFNLASDNYKRAVEKIPQLKDLYQDHAFYMEAWEAIEEARHHHVEKQYGLAKEHYKEAADLHKSTTRWNYLGPNYLAWAKLEEAEDLSRREQTEEAKELFQEAAKLFAEAKKSIQAKVEKVEDKDEKELLANLTEASDAREQYCLGRFSLEEAKILDKQGNHAASSKKYGAANEKFQKATNAMKDESDRQELRPIVCLCQAWQTMTQAEAEASPDLYKEASKLFEEAKDLSLDEKAKMLALGHSRFCKALETGTRFADTRDVRLHDEAERYLDSAANYYVKAGFPGVSEYAEATGLLFDAYVRMDEAKREKDPERKTKLYAMAERVLQTSAGSFMRAEHPEKREQVLRLLEKVKKEQELALSLTELLHAPSIISTTTSFSAPAASQEKAVGSERFEHADVQANLIVRQKELKIGEDLCIELELVNAGKGSAILTKVTEIIPKGFEVAEKPETYRVEDSFINLKGKRLDPLKTEEVKIVLKPTLQGTFSLKPTVLYLDENGKYKSHEPEPVTIVVRELGIKGWLKGER
jgi:hypothetical protein